MVRQLMGGGVPGGLPAEHLGGSANGASAGDTELANIEQIWKAVSDDVENM